MAEVISLNLSFFQKKGGIEEFRIKVGSNIVWQLKSFNSLADDKWNIGQVETNGEKVVIEAVQAETESGYVTLDEITFIQLDFCEIEPPEANINPPTTTTAGNPGQLFILPL